MSLISDGLLLVAAFSAAFYCRVLATRLRRLGDTDKGLGGAISALTIQVDEMKAALSLVANAAEKRTSEMLDLTSRADRAARRLELLLAALHDEQEGKKPLSQAATTLKLSLHDRAARPELKVKKPVLRGLTRNRTIKQSELTR